MKKLFLLCICFTLLCSCDTSNSGNAPTATPKPVPQVVLGSTLKDFEARFADGYRVEEMLPDVVYIFHTDIWDTSAPDYELNLVNGKVSEVFVRDHASNKGATCAAFMPKDNKLVSTFTSDPANKGGGISDTIAIYESKWLAKQFPASSFEDLTSGKEPSQPWDPPQPLAKPGTFTFSWFYMDDYADGECTISIGKTEATG
jgi:hypothetical protein